jgi:hypothetical protein
MWWPRRDEATPEAALEPPGDPELFRRLLFGQEMPIILNFSKGEQFRLKG